MHSNEKEFSPTESLMLIRSMIETTKYSIRDNSHFFLMWGYAVIIGCLLQYVLMVIANYEHHYFAWFVTPVALIIHIIFIVRSNKQEKVKSFISEANGYLWTAIGCSFLVLAFIFSKIGWQYCFPFYILFYGIGTAVSGAMLQFKPLLIGGMVCFIFAAIAAYLPYSVQILLTAFAIFISYIIPGHLLRLHYQKNQAQFSQR